MSQPACHQFTMSSADWVSPTEFLNYIGSEHSLSTKCFHLNCQSVRSKHNELDVFFSSLNFQFDFIILSETWYNRGSLVWHLLINAGPPLAVVVLAYLFATVLMLTTSKNSHASPMTTRFYPFFVAEAFTQYFIVHQVGISRVFSVSLKTFYVCFHV